MRWISVLLVPLLVVLLPTAAYAVDHWGGAPTGSTPTPPATPLALAAYLLMMLGLAWLLTVVFPGTNPLCAFFVAVSSVATMVLFVEYIFIIALSQWAATTPGQVALAWVLKIAILILMIVWGARCCLNKHVSLRQALILAIPVFVPVVFVWVIRLFWKY